MACVECDSARGLCNSLKQNHKGWKRGVRNTLHAGYSTNINLFSGQWRFHPVGASCIGTYIVPTQPISLESVVSLLTAYCFHLFRPCSYYLVTLLPCYPVAMLPCYSVTLFPCYCYLVTLLPCYSVIFLPCYSVTLLPLLLPCYSVTLLPCYSVTLFPC